MSFCYRIEDIAQGNPDPTIVTIKLHLLYAFSDISAARKLSGHMGNSAIKGCSFCDMSFRDQIGHKIIGPVDPKWQSRNREQQLHYAENAANYSQQKLISKESCFKYTKTDRN